MECSKHIYWIRKTEHRQCATLPNQSRQRVQRYLLPQGQGEMTRTLVSLASSLSLLYTIVQQSKLKCVEH